jgi:hypothetical protein
MSLSDGASQVAQPPIIAQNEQGCVQGKDDSLPEANVASTIDQKTSDVDKKSTITTCDGFVEPLKCEEDSPQPGPETGTHPAGSDGSEQPASSTVDNGPTIETENSSSKCPSNTVELPRDPTSQIANEETYNTKEHAHPQNSNQVPEADCNGSQDGKPVKPQKRVTFDLTVQEPKSGVSDSVICLNTNVGWKWKIMEEMNRLEVALRRGENIRGEGSRIFKDDRGRIVLVTKRKVKTSK